MDEKQPQPPRGLSVEERKLINVESDPVMAKPKSISTHYSPVMERHDRQISQVKQTVMHEEIPKTIKDLSIDELQHLEMELRQSMSQLASSQRDVPPVEPEIATMETRAPSTAFELLLSQATPCRRCGLCIGHFESTCPFSVALEDNARSLHVENRGRVLGCGHRTHQVFEYGQSPGCVGCFVYDPMFYVNDTRPSVSYWSYCSNCDIRTDHYTQQCLCHITEIFTDQQGCEQTMLWCGVQGHVSWLRGSPPGCRSCSGAWYSDVNQCIHCGIWTRHKANECAAEIRIMQDGEGIEGDRTLSCGREGHQDFVYGQEPGCKDCFAETHGVVYGA